MKVILVNGSPKQNGCTYTALREVEKSLNKKIKQYVLIQNKELLSHE